MDQQYCACGGTILADTEDWKNPKCWDCYYEMGMPEKDPDITAQQLEGPQA